MSEHSKRAITLGDAHLEEHLKRALLPSGWVSFDPDVLPSCIALKVKVLTPALLTPTSFARLIFSLLSALPPREAEAAQYFTHEQGEGVWLLSAQGWSLEISCGFTEGEVTMSMNPLIHMELVNDQGHAHSRELQLDWVEEEPLEESRSGEWRRWRNVISLLRRAERAGFAKTHGEAKIAEDAYLHPSVDVSGAVQVGSGTRIWHFSKLLGPLTIGERCSFGQNVVIERGVEIGNNVKVQNNVSIYAGVILEDDVFCGPSMVFTNVGTPRSHYPRRDSYAVTRVGQGASIGANATIVCGNQLGRYCFVGAGAVVTHDIPDYALVYGNPARIRGWACYCGVKLHLTAGDTSSDELETAQCEECGRRYEKRGAQVRETTPSRVS